MIALFTDTADVAGALWLQATRSMGKPSAHIFAATTPERQAAKVGYVTATWRNLANSVS